MSEKLPGGSILNSSLLTVDDQEHLAAFNKTYNNFALRVGIINACYETDDESNISKIGPEYDVLVIEQDENKSISGIQYRNCISTDTFGNISDFFEFRYRKQTKAEKNSKRNPAKQNGSFVLLLCLDGSSEKGIIMGALPHASRKEKLDKDLHLHGEYNGLNIKIDKDGAFTIEFKGPRDDNGKYTNEEAGGSTLSIDKDGQIDLNTGNDDYIRIDKKNKDIGLKAGQHIGLTAEKNIGLIAKGNISQTCKDLIAKAEGKASIESASGMDLKTDGSMKINAASLTVNADSSTKITSSQITLDGMTFVGGAGGTPAIIGTTQFLGTGNLGAPVMSLAIGPFSSKVFIAT